VLVKRDGERTGELVVTGHETSHPMQWLAEAARGHARRKRHAWFSVLQERPRSVASEYHANAQCVLLPDSVEAAQRGL
jgi:hypothetical protein